MDLDPVFNHNLDDDYDFRAAGVTRASFWNVYGEWIQFCCEKKRQQMQAAINEKNTPKKTAPSSTIPGPAAASPASTNNGSMKVNVGTSREHSEQSGNGSGTNKQQNEGESSMNVPTTSISCNNGNGSAGTSNQPFFNSV